jgi:CheY-like chemotaxis protein
MNEKIMKKVLITDDEPYIRLLVKRALGMDHIVLEASNGEEAVNIARTEKPDLILMDILMPKLDGFAACRKIRNDEATRGIPVVLLTGSLGLNGEVVEGAGADGYIFKPFDVQGLRDQVKWYESVKHAQPDPELTDGRE